MSENKNQEADKLKKEIVYLSGLINSAKTKSALQQRKQYQKVSSASSSTSNNYSFVSSQPYGQYEKFHQQNSFIPFPKSSKYIAPSGLSKTHGIIKNHQNSAASKEILSKSLSCPVLLQSKSFKSKNSTTQGTGTYSQSTQDKIVPHSRYDSSNSTDFVNIDHVTKSYITGTKNPELKEVKGIKMHVNPKFLRNIPSSTSASTSNMPVVKLSETVCVPKFSLFDTRQSQSFPKTPKESSKSLGQDSKKIESQIQALRKTLGYEIPQLINSKTISYASTDKNKLVQKVTGKESASNLKQPNIQKQIMDLRKTLGYEIPSASPQDSIKEQILNLRASMGYKLPDDNRKERKLTQKPKSQSDPYHFSPTSSPVISLSPYKIDKAQNCKVSSAKLNTSYASDQCQKLNSRSQTSKYVLNRRKPSKTLSPKIIKSRFKYILKSQGNDTPIKMAGSSTTQKAAKTIISKYKIRNGTEIKKCKLPYSPSVHDTSYNLRSPVKNSWLKKDTKLPQFRSAYKWSSKTKNNLKTNVYTWRRSSHSNLISQRRLSSSNKINTGKFHHLNMLRRNERHTTDRRSNSNSNLVFINGFLYKTTGNSMLKTGSKKVDNRKNRSSTPSWDKYKPIIIKKVNGKETKTVQVRGVTFEMAANGHSLKRIDTSTGERKSPENKSKVTRIDLHGITYIQTKPGTLLKMDTLRTRAVTSRAINKSINTIVTNKQRKKINKQYCIYYNRFGKCNRGTLCKFIHDPEKIAVCTRFLRGTCKVKNCLFSHQVSESKMPVCSYFLKGRCNKDDCPYLHVKVSQNAAICLSFINGYCPNGKECKKLHTRICPEYSKTGKCKSGKKCQLQHKSKNNMKRKNSNSSKLTTDIKAKEDNVTVGASTTNTTKLPSYISLVEYSSPYIPPKTNQHSTHTPPDQDQSLHIRPRL